MENYITRKVANKLETDDCMSELNRATTYFEFMLSIVMVLRNTLPSPSKAVYPSGLVRQWFCCDSHSSQVSV